MENKASNCFEGMNYWPESDLPLTPSQSTGIHFAQSSTVSADLTKDLKLMSFKYPYPVQL